MKIITITGHAGKDATLQYTDKGVAIAKVNVAVNEYGSDEPVWFSVTVFGKRGETVAQYLKRGMYVVVMGDLKVTAKEGGGWWLNVTATEIDWKPIGKAQDSTPEDENIPF